MPDSAAGIASSTAQSSGGFARTAAAIAIDASPPICAHSSTRSVPDVRACHGPTKSATPHARLAPSASRTARHSTGRVAAIASSWFAW